MITTLFRQGDAIRRLAFALVGICSVLAGTTVNFASSEPSSSESTNSTRPVEQLSQSINDLKRAMTDLPSTVEVLLTTLETLEKSRDLKKTRAQIEILRQHLLSLSDQSAYISKLADKTSNDILEHLDFLKRADFFRSEDKDFLIDEWRRMLDDTSRVRQTIIAAQVDFDRLSRELRRHDALMAEYILLGESARGVAALKQLAAEIRSSSDRLTKTIFAIKLPGV